MTTSLAGDLLTLIPAAIILTLCLIAATLPGDPDDQ